MPMTKGKFSPVTRLIEAYERGLIDAHTFTQGALHAGVEPYIIELVVDSQEEKRERTAARAIEIQKYQETLRSASYPAIGNITKPRRKKADRPRHTGRTRRVS